MSWVVRRGTHSKSQGVVMGQVISVVQSKGGAGKSTLVVALACQLAGEGAKVSIIDTDKQCTAEKWAKHDVVERGHIDHIVELSELEITDLVRQLKNDYDYVLIDTAGFDNRISGFVMVESDLVLVPSKATISDAQGAVDTKKYLDATAKSVRAEIPCFGVRMDFDRGTVASDQVNGLLDQNGCLAFLDTTQWHATAFKDMINTGHPPRGRAKSLVQALVNEMRLKKVIPLPVKRKQAA